MSLRPGFINQIEDEYRPAQAPTAGMIEAGLGILFTFDREEQIAEEVVAEIWAAMDQVRQLQLRAAGHGPSQKARETSKPPIST